MARSRSSRYASACEAICGKETMLPSPLSLGSLSISFSRSRSSRHTSAC
jgi:hypothetical protein